MGVLVKGLVLLLTAWTTVSQDIGEDQYFTGIVACQNKPQPPGVAVWSDSLVGTVQTVVWSYGNNTCASVKACFGVTEGPDEELHPQMKPIIVQQGVTFRFNASQKIGLPFKMQPYWVSEQGFKSCKIEGGTPVYENATDSPIAVGQQFLKPGPNYFIVAPGDNFFKCEFGLRLNITVRPQQCRPRGLVSKCTNRGVCLARQQEFSYHCQCCHGYEGEFCHEINACASSPCKNNGACTDVVKEMDPTGKRFTCTCPRGYIGSTCKDRIGDLCLQTPCENNATCNGNSTHFRCSCLPGFAGVHCEVNINECQSNPCQHGVCKDGTNSYECYCKPGYGGKQCEKEYNECQSSPCKNGGFCIDQVNGFRCDCGRGYSGKDCSTKVDLCNPNPCRNATKCFDRGNTVTCDCSPGFTGPHCEVNVNECESTPCKNGGSCKDMENGYRCYCLQQFRGINCEHVVKPPAPKPFILPTENDQSKYSYHRNHFSHVQNLYIIAGTLAGALLIALAVLAGCYCRIYKTYRMCTPKAFMYRKQEETAAQMAQQDVASVGNPRPSIEAIFEATSMNYHENSMNTPLINSLKPKRV